MGEQGWRQRAACKNADLALFYPDTPGGSPAARAVCAGCPVQSECLDESLRNDERGVWGGMGEDQRKQLRRGGLTLVCVTCEKYFKARTRHSHRCPPCREERLRLQQMESHRRYVEKRRAAS